MASHPRHNFSPATKTKLCRATGGVCSNPNCRKFTLGSTEDGTSTINVGKAAHITAAAPNGPRYDAALTREQRSHADNGLWLCSTCADLVDNDDAKYTISDLLKWKADANREAHLRVSSGMTAPLPQSPPSSGDEAQGACRERVEHAVSVDLSRFRSQPGWARGEIELDIQLQSDTRLVSVKVAGLADGLEVNPELLLVSAPGTGKTTTMIQLTGALLERKRFVPLFLPLKEWAQQNRDLLDSTLARGALSDLKIADLTSLAERGELALLLDGWNELSTAGKERATSQISALRRDYPLLRLITSTRREAIDLPFGGIRANILPLSEKLQLEIAESVAGTGGSDLLQRAWRTPGVRDLVSIPLYLSVLLTNAPNGTLPETKEQILGLFVARHDNDPAGALRLRELTQNTQTDIMTALAFEAMKAGDVTISESVARSIVAAENERLVSGGQLIAPLQPSTVLDVLVAHHVLVRSEDRLLSFQHQQFQEWYASLGVERSMVVAIGSEAALASLRAEILNVPHWEEAVLFAVERLSRTAGGDRAVAIIVLETLMIDPMLAAEMVFRASDAMWVRIRNEVVAFANRWHQAGTIDRAVTFMIMTGRPDFADVIWPFLGNPDQQVHLAATRAAPRFRMGVLGDDVPTRMRAIDQQTRSDLLSELVMNGDMSAIELAAALAAADQSPAVRIEVIKALVFRAAGRLASSLLNGSEVAVWRALAERHYDEDFEDEDVTARLQVEREKLLEEETSLTRRIGLLRHMTARKGLERDIIDLVADPDFPVRDQSVVWTLQGVMERFPSAMNAAVIRRLEQGLELPYGSDEIVAKLPTVDDGPIAQCALMIDEKRHRDHDAAKVIGVATIGALIDRLLEMLPYIGDRSRRPSQAERDVYFNLKDRIAKTRFEPFAEAILARGNTGDIAIITALADLIVIHEPQETESKQLTPLPATAARLHDLVKWWSDALLNSPEASRHDFAKIVEVIARLPDKRHLPALTSFLEQDLCRWRAAKDQWRRSRGRSLNADTSMSYGLQYRNAFAAIGGESAAQVMSTYLLDDLFGSDAAHAMRAIYDQRAGIGRPSRRWPDFSTVARRREGDSTSSLPPAPEAEAITTAVRALIAPGTSESENRRALDIAFVAFLMPLHKDEQLIEQLLALPLAWASKLKFITALTVGGFVPSADMLLAAVREWFDQAEKETWRLDERKWEVVRWMELLPFSDRPMVTLEAFDLAGELLEQPWEYRDLLNSLRYAPGQDAESILIELAKRDERFMDLHEWLRALLDLRTRSSVLSLIDLYRDRRPNVGRGVDSHFTSEALAEATKSDPQLRLDLLLRYADNDYAACRGLIEQVLAKSPDPPTILAMVDSYAQRGKRFDGCLAQAVENAATTHRQLHATNNTYQIEPVAAASLRRDLFTIHRSGGAASEIARVCLVMIDELRDDYGRPDEEDRHPDIGSGTPWPIEVPYDRFTI